MMNLDEILKGIGSQMSRAIPSWNEPAAPPQIQNPTPELGGFGGFLAGRLPEAGPSFGGGFPEQSGFGTGFQEKSPGGFGMFQENPNPRQQDALGHVHAAATAATTAAHAGTPSTGDQETEQYIRQAAAKRGIDPDIAVRVWGSEGRSNYAGDNNSSFGPYQLHYGNVAGGGNSVGGLGDAFTAATGLDARDPKTWQAQVDFSLDHVRRGGWTPWHGAAAAGVGPQDGVGTYTPPATAPTAGGNNYVFPVEGYNSPVQLHWGAVKGGSDLFAPRGTPVKAMRGGRVVESGYNGVGGNSVLIQGDDGNQYYYAHMDSTPAVGVGQTVGAGTYLGPVGDTGDAKGTGAHLHIGIGPSIRLGADKYGGTGGDYDAVGLLNSVLGR